MQIRVGTRGSKLALAQCDSVIEMLQKKYPDCSFEKVIIHTKGDLNDRPLSSIGGNGLFVREIEQQLIDGSIDMAVHSMKDLPSKIGKGLMICTPLQREESQDVLVLSSSRSLLDLPQGATVATGSVRRKMQLLNLRKDLNIVDIRGNIDTRIRKMMENGYDGIVLAKAGLNRLAMEDLNLYEFSITEMIPSPCQGVLAVEIRNDREDLQKMMDEISDPDTTKEAFVERAFLKEMNADCRRPIGARAFVKNDVITLHAIYGNASRLARTTVTGTDCSEVARLAACQIRSKLSGMVRIVGAGPGDPEMVTLKGMRVIQEADCILYDRLIPGDLLKAARSDCQMIYVGKADHMHTLKQSQINELLVEKAMEYRNVVRLKGGDISLFARTQEEVTYLEEKGIPYELISGVSSCMAGPMAIGIPLTARGVCSGFHVLSAHGSHDGINDLPYDQIACSHDTWVLLMGLRHVKQIARNLILHDMDGNTPIAVISNATTPMQKTHVSTIGGMIHETVDLPSPAIIVIGETVRFYKEKQESTEIRKEVYLPKIGHEKSALLDLIPDVTVHEIPVSVIEYLDYQQDVIPDVALFTSRNGVEGFFRNLKQDIRAYAKTVFACVGKSTARKLQEYGIHADVVPQTYDSESLRKQLHLQEDTVVCHYCGTMAGNHSRMYRGYDYRAVSVYDNRELPIEMMDVPQDATIVFTCSSNVERMKRRMIHFEEWAKQGTALVIGPSTYQTCQQLGIVHIIQARRADYESLAELIV